VTEVLVNLIERKDLRVGLWVVSLLIELAEDLECMRGSVCESMSFLLEIIPCTAGALVSKACL
jgi:hypothetical protein